MNAAQKREAWIERLAPFIGRLGPNFERFGGVFMGHYLRASLLHTGINLSGSPISGVVDSVSDGGDIVVEYSTDDTYFVGRMTKARNDAKGALEKHPNLKQLYLVSGRRAPDKKREALTRLFSPCKREKDIVVAVFDARRIVEGILDELAFNDLAIAQLSEFVPELRLVHDEYAASESLPPLDENYIPRPEVEAAVEAMLKTEACVSLVGLAGNGKSASAIALGYAATERYDIVIWIDARHLRHVNELKHSAISRVGEKRNVKTLLTRQSCLLILDDLGDEIAQSDLAALCGPNSKIIVTRRKLPDNAPHVDLGLMSDAEAAILLDAGGVELCPPAVRESILAAVGEHPFTLALMNAAVRNRGMTWTDVAADCEEGHAASFEKSQQRVADRILERLAQPLKGELELFRWCGASSVDRAFAHSVCGNAGLHSLRQYCLTSGDLRYVVRVHDIVYASIETRVTVSAERRKALLDALEKYILNVVFRDDLAFTALAFSMSDKVDAIVQEGERRPAFIYAWQRSWEGSGRNVQRLGDPLVQARELHTRGAPPKPLDVATILETVEIIYRSMKGPGGANTAKDWLRDHLQVFDVLESISGLDDRARSEISHHRGKALNLTNDRAGAAAAFEAVLSGPHPLHEARLQLVKLYARDKAKWERAIDLANELFEAALKNPSEVASSVLLAAAESLPLGRMNEVRRDYMAKYSDLVEDRLIKTAEAGSDQVYQTFASVGRDWAWHDPDRYRRVLPHIPRLVLEATRRDGDRFNYADILREAAETVADDLAEKASLRAESLRFFEALERPGSFQKQKLGQLYVEMGRFEDAARVLEAIKPEGEDRFRRLWLSKAYLGLGETEAALALSEAIVAETEEGDVYLSTFLAQRFEARYAVGREEAGEDLRSAIGLSTSAPSRARLKKRLGQLGLS